MKNLTQLLFGLVLAIVLFSCDASKDPVTPDPGGPDDPGSPPAAVTPVGTPEGVPVTATIGPEGGKVESADKRILVTIPAGALTTNQTISVQQLTNQCPEGSGAAFRLLPHGTNFAKPASITFHYDDTDINGSAPALLRIAYQNDKGSWQSPPTKGIDTVAHTLTVQTTHFSDWGVFKTLALHPVSSFINPGGNVHLEAVQVMGPEVTDDELLVPLGIAIPAKYIKKWTLSGEGVLDSQENKADYHAPAQIPAANPVAVTVSLNRSVTIDGQVFTDLRLVANIFVAPEGISLQVEGGEWQTYPGGANLNSEQNVVLGSIGDTYASVLWKGAPSGRFFWTKDTDVTFNFIKPKLIYQHLYGTGPSVSGGSLLVDATDPVWVTGTFTVKPAGWTNLMTTPVSIGSSNIRGVFRVKRVN